MPLKKPSSKETSVKSLKEICHQFNCLELDSSGTSFTSGSTKPLRSTRNRKEGGEGTGHERSPYHISESSPESISSCSYETESTSLSGEGRNGYSTYESSIGDDESSSSGSTSNSLSELTSSSSSNSSSSSSSSSSSGSNSSNSSSGSNSSNNSSSNSSNNSSSSSGSLSSKQRSASSSDTESISYMQSTRMSESWTSSQTSLESETDMYIMKPVSF